MVTKLRDVMSDLRLKVSSAEVIAAWEEKERLDREKYERELVQLQADEALAARRLRISEFRCTDAMRDALVDGTFTETDAVKRARAWFADRDKPWLVLSGPTGCGKSMAAAAIPAECVKAGERVAKFVRSDELVRLFSSMFGEQYEKQQEIRDATFLVIDDLGCEFDASRMLPTLLDLLDSRQSAKRHPTIVTTNLTPQAFRDRYANDRLNGRMAELVRWEGVTSEDLRRRK